MTAKEFVAWAFEGTYEDYNLEKGLQVLSQYMGKNSDYYLQFPDYIVKNEEGEILSELLDEPVGFQEYWENK